MANRELAEMLERAYPRRRRVRDVIRFIRKMSKLQPNKFELTKSAFIARTYNIEVALVKRIKAKFRNELTFEEGGK